MYLYYLISTLHVLHKFFFARIVELFQGEGFGLHPVKSMASVSSAIVPFFMTIIPDYNFILIKYN